MFRLGIPEALIILAMCGLPIWLFVLIINAAGASRKTKNILVAGLMFLVFTSVSAGLLVGVVGQEWASPLGFVIGALLTFLGWREITKRAERQSDDH